MTRRGTPAVFDTSASGATRICLEAKRYDLDISGTVFEVGSEPYTPAKARVVADANARAIDRYSASEFGTTGLGCAASSQVDDMHLVTDKVIVTSRNKVLDESGAQVPVLIFTTLLGNCPKIMINAESGDYGHLEERDCGCLLADVGFKTHVLGVHGYDKLTSEGVTFMGTELYRLVEEVLPSRFGGNPIDYQLVEQEDEHGLPRVQVLVSPSVGTIDEQAVVTTVLDALKGYDRYGRGRFMADQWRQGRTLQIVRRVPYEAGSRKILPLHILQPSGVP
jgi:phenylacetate-coenzyme A ligase PaaK-like adenylate-forming protein